MGSGNQRASQRKDRQISEGGREEEAVVVIRAMPVTWHTIRAEREVSQKRWQAGGEVCGTHHPPSTLIICGGAASNPDFGAHGKAM
jgi:hypothetical protein